MQNGKRQNQPRPRDESELPQPVDPPAKTLPGEYDAQMVEHVRMFTSLMEGRKVSRPEVLKMLTRAEKKRQHSIGDSEKIEYRVREQKKNST